MAKIKNIGFFLIFCLVQMSVSAQSDYKIAEQDSLALIAFYNSTNGSNWISNQEGFGFDNLTSEWQATYSGGFNNWFDGPVKDWFGIKVEKRPIQNSVDSTYRVTWLWPVIGRRTDGQNLLDGYIPKEIGLLTGLEQFRVNGNDGFRDELIPDELYHTSLEHFDTEAAWFGGGLSNALRNCVNMGKLNIRYNNYDYMPNLDFLGEEGARNLNGTQWFYNSRFSYFYMERIVDFFFSISPNPMEFGFEARDMFDVGDEIEIVAPLGSSVEMICNDAGMREEFITYQWFKDGLSKFGKKNKTYSFSSIKASDYGHYKTRITNEYVKSYDTNGNYGEVFTKGVRLVPAPIAPEITKSVVANNGRYIDLYFSKTMTGASGFLNLVLTADGNNVNITDALVRGRINREVRVFLENAIQVDETVTLNYSGDTIKDKNGGTLLPLVDLQVENRARISPAIVKAETTTDGSGILVHFDYYIDPTSISTATFSISGDNEYNVANIILSSGEVDRAISKTLFVTLDNTISDSAEVVMISYDDGQLFGLYGGTVSPSGSISVENNVTVDRTNVLLQFEDGTNNIKDVLIAASWRATPIQLYDDGTNGDELADDHTWSYLASLADDFYKWDVLSRNKINVIDTIKSVDAQGNIVLTLVPGTVNIDSILNTSYVLEFTVGNDEVNGDTIFGIYNRDVVFNVQVDAQGKVVYLMGIENDWNNGLPMIDATGNVYTFTIPDLTAGDILLYNYRRGSSWENQTPDTRSYVVKNGLNIINDNFGIFTSTVDEVNNILKIYPNPTLNSSVTIEGLEGFTSIKAYNGLGQLLFIKTNLAQDKIELNLPKFKGILYLVTSQKNQRNTITRKIIMH